MMDSSDDDNLPSAVVGQEKAREKASRTFTTTKIFGLLILLLIAVLAFNLEKSRSVFKFIAKRRYQDFSGLLVTTTSQEANNKSGKIMEILKKQTLQEAQAPLQSKNHTQGANFTKSVIIIENRPLRLELLENFINYTTPDWSFEFFVTNMPEIKDPIIETMNRAKRQFTFVHTFDRLVKDLRRNTDINPVLKSCKFWNTVRADVVLVVQMDAVLCPSNYSINDFVHYHYVGAPWPQQVPRRDRATISGLQTPLYGGNGGLSIRSKEHMLLCCDNNIDLSSLRAAKISGKPVLNEDLYYEACFRKHELSVRLGIASSFSLENMVTRNATDVLGMHKPNVRLMRSYGLRSSDINLIGSLCEKCPPLNLIMRCPRNTRSPGGKPLYPKWIPWPR